MDKHWHTIILHEVLIIHSNTHSKFVDQADKFVVHCDIYIYIYISVYKLRLHQALFVGLLGSIF